MAKHNIILAEFHHNTTSNDNKGLKIISNVENGSRSDPIQMSVQNHDITANWNLPYCTLDIQGSEITKKEETLCLMKTDKNKQIDLSILISTGCGHGVVPLVDPLFWAYKSCYRNV